MSDITDSDEALEKDVQKLTIAVSSLSQAKGDARRRKIEVCDNLLEVVQEAVEETAEGDPKKLECQRKLKMYKQAVRTAKDNLKQAKSQGDHNEADPRSMNTDQMLEKLTSVQHKTDSALNSALERGKHALKMGKSIVVELRENGESIVVVSDDAKTLSMLIKNFAKRITMDHLIQCSLALIFICIVFIIMFAT